MSTLPRIALSLALCLALAAPVTADEQWLSWSIDDGISSLWSSLTQIGRSIVPLASGDDAPDDEAGPFILPTGFQTDAAREALAAEPPHGFGDDPPDDDEAGPFILPTG
ncbi:MAG: hypothetical protein AAGC60_27495 [Acidobacteriota bacterium]